MITRFIKQELYNTYKCSIKTQFIIYSNDFYTIQ